MKTRGSQVYSSVFFDADAYLLIFSKAMKFSGNKGWMIIGYVRILSASR